MNKLKLANFRINSELWDNFLLYCQRNGTTAKEELTSFIEKKIENKDYSWQAQENKAIADIDLLKEAHEKIALRLERLEKEIELIRKLTDANQINCQLEQENSIVVNSFENKDKDRKADKALLITSKKDQIDQEIKNALNPWRDDQQIARRANQYIPDQDDGTETNLDRLFTDREIGKIYGLGYSYFAQARKQNFPPKKLLNLFSGREVVGSKWRLKPVKPLTTLEKGRLVIFDPNLNDEWIGLYGKIEKSGKSILVRLWNGEVKVASFYDLYQPIEKS